MNKQDYTGFVAEFRNSKELQKALDKNNVEVPKGWESHLENFKVVTDLGRQLEIAFWNWKEDKQVGETSDYFIVDYDDVVCWS